MKIKLHKNDLPNDISFGKSVAIDTEAMGLNHKIVQINKYEN